MLTNGAGAGLVKATVTGSVLNDKLKNKIKYHIVYSKYKIINQIISNLIIILSLYI